MRIATVRTAGQTRAARLEGDEFIVLEAVDAATALARGETSTDGPRIALSEAELAPPSVAPRKILCMGLNYESHIKEMGKELPEYPTLFAKFARALVGPRDPIELPTVSDSVDWEVELAAVIGREVRGAGREEAREAICGYIILNDVSVRDYQWRSTQWLSGKTFERSTPTGPWIVTPDEIDHGADLEVRCEVDGEVMQQARTSDLVFDAPALVSYASDIITLEPGDIVSTGTPGGVGAARNPEVWLRPGQEVRCTIEGIGELRNTCQRGATGE